MSKEIVTELQRIIEEEIQKAEIRQNQFDFPSNAALELIANLKKIKGLIEDLVTPDNQNKKRELLYQDLVKLGSKRELLLAYYVAIYSQKLTSEAILDSIEHDLNYLGSELAGKEAELIITK